MNTYDAPNDPIVTDLYRPDVFTRHLLAHVHRVQPRLGGGAMHERRGGFVPGLECPPTKHTGRLAG